VRIFAKFIVPLCLTLVLGAAPASVQAVACGINIDPTNPAGYPSPNALPAGSWVRLEYKDCSTQEPATNSVEMYKDVLQTYRNAGIKTLVILDYLTYPGADKNTQALATRTTYINEELGSLVDAYEIWNEPDIEQGGNLAPKNFAKILDAIVPTLSGKTVVLGGLASGQTSYLDETLRAVSENTLGGISAIGIHPYAKSVDGFPGPMTGDMGFLLSQYKALSQGKPLWITEIGINTKNAEQITGYLDRVFAAGYGDPTFWFAWSDGMVQNFGIVDADQNPKANFSNYFRACGAVAPSGKQQTLPAITPVGGQGCGVAISKNNYKDTKSDDPNLFHLSPFDGLYPDPGTRDYDQLRLDLVQQGYQAYCAIPDQEIVGTLSPAEIVKYFVSNGGEKELEINPILTLDYSKAQTPLFRDSERKYQIKSDIEEYWVYQESEGDSFSQIELQSAPIESILSEDQRCSQGVKNLYSQDDMCSKLTEPKRCSLYASLIPNTSHTVESILEEYKSHGGSKENGLEVCKKLRLANENTQRKLFSDLTQVPLSIDTGFRFAFLVLAFQELKPAPLELFRFFGHGAPPRDEVLVIAFKIPDIITNKPEGTSFSDSNSFAYPAFSDGALLARDSLLSTKQQAVAQEQKKELKQELTTTIGSVAGQNNGSLIYCLDGTPPNGTGSIACNDQLVKALTDIINAQHVIDDSQLVCVGKDEIDASFVIDEPAAARIQSPPALFSDRLGAQIISQLFLSQANTATDALAKEFFSSFLINISTTEGGNKLSGNTKLRSYIVYPVGYELKEVENVLANSFLTKQQITALQKDTNNNERFEMYGGTTKLTETEAGFSVFYPINCIPSIDSCYRTITGAIDMGVLKPIQFLGAKLGYYLRAVQRTLAKEASSVQAYLANCKTTEQFLLDRCASVQQKPPKQALTYCSMNELPITNETTESFKICKATENWRECELVDAGSPTYFVDGGSDNTLEYVVRILDGATLVTTGSVVTMNPGQGYDKVEGSYKRCGVGDSESAPGEVWYLPPGTPADESIESFRTWAKYGSKLMPIIGSNAWTNLTVSLRVKPGYYHIPSWTFGCLSRGKWWINSKGEKSDDGFTLGKGIIPVGITASGKQSYCAKVTLNSNMPGGPSDSDEILLDSSYSCSIADPGYNLTLNNNCGGLNSSGDGQLWRDLFSADDERGTNKLPGLALYEKIFGIAFTVPSDNIGCDQLFPNTIREVACDEVSNSDVGSIANFGSDVSFDIEYWNHSMVTFKPPSQEIWSAIQTASAKHRCDPYLVLAVAHSESSQYRNDTVSSAGAKGVWQFTDDTWDTWKTPHAASANECQAHQPPTFSTEGLDFSSPTNIQAAADSACRKIMWIGMQRYPGNLNSFARVFAVNGDNPYSQIWNAHIEQGKYVWRLWKKLREIIPDAKTPRSHPANYPQAGWESCPQRRN